MAFCCLAQSWSKTIKLWKCKLSTARNRCQRLSSVNTVLQYCDYCRRTPGSTYCTPCMGALSCSNVLYFAGISLRHNEAMWLCETILTSAVFLLLFKGHVQTLLQLVPTKAPCGNRRRDAHEAVCPTHNTRQSDSTEHHLFPNSTLSHLHLPVMPQAPMTSAQAAQAPCFPSSGQNTALEAVTLSSRMTKYAESVWSSRSDAAGMK